MVLVDTFCGAFLGFVLTVAYKRFLLNLNSKEEHRTQENKKSLAQFRELEQDRECLRKAHIPDPPSSIYTRTRSRT